MTAKDVAKGFSRSFLAKHNFRTKKTDSKDSFVRVLMYHEIEKIPSSCFGVSLDAFEEQIKYLCDNFLVISLNEMYSFLQGEFRLSQPAVAITIDDGFRCVYFNGYSILKKYNLPATVFFVADYLKIGKDYSSGKEYLKLEDIIEMKNNRMTFGSHSKEHLALSSMTIEKARDNIFESKEYLESQIDEKIDFFSYPFGLMRHFNKDIKNIVKEAGYKCAFTAINGINFRKSDPFALRRTKIERDDSFETFKSILKGALDVWAYIDCLPWLK